MLSRIVLYHCNTYIYILVTSIYYMYNIQLYPPLGHHNIPGISLQLWQLWTNPPKNGIAIGFQSYYWFLTDGIPFYFLQICVLSHIWLLGLGFAQGTPEKTINMSFLDSPNEKSEPSSTNPTVQNYVPIVSFLLFMFNPNTSH